MKILLIAVGVIIYLIALLVVANIVRKERHRGLTFSQTQNIQRHAGSVIQEDDYRSMPAPAPNLDDLNIVNRSSHRD